MSDKFYLTTPIYYVNARPHIGHAYTTIVADVLARRHRLLGRDTFFLTGTDEHGQKIERSALAAGVPPQQFADQVSASFQNLWKRMGITNDAFIRTTDPRHKQGVQKLFATLQQNGFIELRTYTGQYCVSEEMFVEGPPGTIGPDGRPTETVSEENYFFRLSEFQLPLLNLIESNTLVITSEARRNEVLSFLRGNVTAVAKLEYVTERKADKKVSYPQSKSVTATDLNTGTRPEAVTVSEANQTQFQAESVTLGEAHNAQPKDLEFSAAGIPYLPGALKDLSISRSSFTWGIPVPGDERHVIYVWLDALANYMTAIGYGSDDPADQANFAHYWPADLHLVGKEIIRFHCVYWPAFLMAAGLPLPKAITAHGWLLFEDSKMSKTRGNIVRTETILDAFGPLCPSSPNDLSSSAEARGPAVALPTPATKAEQDLFASDILRYFLLREIPFGQDGSFSFDALITRYNADLANGYGNLVSRTLGLISQNSQLDWTREPVRPYFCAATGKAFVSPDDAIMNVEDAFTGTEDVIRVVLGTIEVADDFYRTVQFNLARVALAVSIIDKYISSQKPWLLAKSSSLQDRKKLSEILYTAAESIRILTALLYPILPHATANVWRQLGLGDIEKAAKNGVLKDLKWGGLQPGTKLGPLSPIFPRADKGLAQIMTDMEAPQPEAPTKPSLAEAPISRLKTITTAPPIPADPSHPGAPPRTSAMSEPNPGVTVAASYAISTERADPISHHDAPASLPFATPAAASSVPPSDQATPQIAIDDFVKIDLRVARILLAERIPKADKLLRLEVDLGPSFNPSTRQILSGIAEWYTPEELVGRRIVVITNLAPRRMRGLESHGMLLAASTEPNGRPVLATFADTDEIPLGSRLK